MIIKKSAIATLNIIVLSLTSNLAMAAETTSINASFPGWPLLLLIVVLIVFRKKIFAEAAIDQQEEMEQKITEPQESSTIAPPTPLVKTPSPKKTKDGIKKEKNEASASSIDLSDDSQCQASTAKGSRCKRTTALEKTSVKIENKTYQITVCSQHNNDKVKPFSGLIK